MKGHQGGRAADGCSALGQRITLSALPASTDRAAPRIEENQEKAKAQTTVRTTAAYTVFNLTSFYLSPFPHAQSAAGQARRMARPFPDLRLLPGRVGSAPTRCRSDAPCFGRSLGFVHHPFSPAPAPARSRPSPGWTATSPTSIRPCARSTSSPRLMRSPRRKVSLALPPVAVAGWSVWAGLLAGTGDAADARLDPGDGSSERPARSRWTRVSGLGDGLSVLSPSRVLFARAMSCCL